MISVDNSSIGSTRRIERAPGRAQSFQRPAGILFILKSDRGGLLRPGRPYGVKLFVALFDAASPLVPRNGGADMVRASALAGSSDFPLRPAGCQGKDLIAQIRRAALGAIWYSGRGAWPPASSRWNSRHRYPGGHFA